MHTSGFPAAEKEQAERGRVSETTKKSMLDWLRVDWAKVGKSEAYMKEVLSFLLRAGCTPVSWLSITKNTSIGSSNTAQSYVETLEKLLVVKTLELVEPSGRVAHRKTRKYTLPTPS
ncbi:MAG: hypothetical protein QW688_07170 [Thermoprotei archaeon]